jgi:putative flippase GtrA
VDQESHEARLRRNLNELLQELRVAQAGVQILFGFLLAVTFTEPYLRASDFTHGVHLVAAGLAVIAAGLMTAPAAWHRVLFRQGQRDRILRISNRFALAGLACLAGAVSATVLLLVDVIVGFTPAVVAAAVIALGFATVWFAMPLRHRDPAETNPEPVDSPAMEDPQVAGNPQVAGSRT